MKKLFFLGACLVALASAPAMAQTGGVEVVVVRLEFVGGNSYRLYVSRGVGNTSVTDVKDKGNTLVEVYQQTAAQLIQQGYVLRSSLGQGVGGIMLFVKGQP